MTNEELIATIREKSRELEETACARNAAHGEYMALDDRVRRETAEMSGLWHTFKKQVLND